MPFFLPIVALGAGVSLIVWGSRQLWKADDSADQMAAKFLRNVPEHVRKYIESVNFGPDGLRVTLRSDAPVEVEKELQKNVKTVKA